MQCPAFSRSKSSPNARIESGAFVLIKIVVRLGAREREKEKEREEVLGNKNENEN